jgi:uncharacterized membrane protein YfcA
MARPIALALLLCLVGSPPALGQAVSTPPPGLALESLLQGADSAGRDAARQRGVGGYFATSFVGGFPAGLFGPVGVAASQPTLLVVGGAGAAIVIATTARGARRDLVEFPPLLMDQLKDQPPAYREAFLTAYAEHLSRRRVHASLWGGAIGAGVGFGTLVWLISRID